MATMIDALLKNIQDVFKFIGKLPEKFMKKGTTQLKGEITGQSKSFFTWDNWPYFLAIIALIILIWLLIRQIKRRRAAAADQSAPPQVEKTLACNSLRQIWKTFLKAIPGEFRRSILFYQHFLVFGDIGSGKSRLIDTYTDWKGQANQFYPSYTSNPLLQIYLGTKALVQEIPASLLNNTSMDVRVALQCLWKPLFRWRDPTVVVVVHADMLQSGDPEALKRQAQMIRGKINIVSRIRKKPVAVRLAVTSADSLPGYAPFFTFLRRQGKPLALTFATPSDLAQIRTCLEPYEDLLPQALTTLPAEDYLNILSFFKKMPDLLEALSTFIQILQNPDPLSPAPELHQVFLTSDNPEDRRVCNPFQAAEAKTDARGLLVLYRHQIAAAALAFAGMTAVTAGFVHDRRAIAAAEQALVAFGSPDGARPAGDMIQRFHQAMQDTRRKGAAALLPRFSADDIAVLRQRVQREYVAALRKFYLIPRLDQLAWEEDAADKQLFLIALIYASEKNRLGELVADDIQRWSGMLALPAPLITEYIKFNHGKQDISIPFDPSLLNDALTTAYNPRPWMLFFNDLKKITAEPMLSLHMARDIQQQATRFLETIEAAERSDLSAGIAALLRQETRIGMRPDIQRPRHRDQLLQQPLRAFLVFLRNSRMQRTPTGEMTLEQILDAVRLTLLSSHSENRTFKFAIGSERYAFNAADWHQLIARTSLTHLLRDIQRRDIGPQDAAAFLGVKDVYPEIGMNTTNDGRFIFTGKAVVPGIYTREALEHDVKPVLNQVPEVISGLPLAENEKIRFMNYIQSMIDTYARQYENAYRRYYRAFDITAPTPEALKFALTQLQLPASPLLTLLEVIRENTTVENDANPFFQPIRHRLQSFAFVRRILVREQDGLSELDKYQALVKQMETMLLDEAPYVPGEEAQPGDALKRKSSPLGRLFLSVYLEEEGSYYDLIQKWLQSVGVDPVWHFPFLDPVYQAYRQGMAEVEALIEREWSAMESDYVDPVLTRFPFDKTAEEETTPEEALRLLAPQGEFGNNFIQYILPFCKKSGDDLIVRDFPMGGIHLPENVLSTEQTIARLRQRFFDEQGNPIPLTIEVKPVLTPPGEPSPAVVVLSHLQCGKSSVFGFYQQPAWQKLRFQWWERQQSSVGVELTTRKHLRKSSRHLSVPRSSWSLLHLLNKAQALDDNVLLWKIDSPEMPSGVIDVMFAVKSNPWECFNPARTP